MADTPTTPVTNRLELAQRLAGDPAAAQRVRDAWQPMIDFLAERPGGVAGTLHGRLPGVAGTLPERDCPWLP